MADRPLPTQRLGAGGRGPGSSARSPPAAATHTRVHTHSRASLFAATDGHGQHRACVCRRVVIPRCPRVLSPEAAQAAVGSRGPRV